MTVNGHSGRGLEHSRNHLALQNSGARRYVFEMAITLTFVGTDYPRNAGDLGINGASVLGRKQSSTYGVVKDRDYYVC